MDGIMIKRGEITNSEKFKRTGKAICKRHGVHEAWRYIKNGAVICRICQRETNRRLYIERTLADKFYKAKWHSNRIGREFTITFEFIQKLVEVQNNKCAITGIQFSDMFGPYFISIDRIDSSKGYTEDNVQLVLARINKMKSNLNQDDFINICKVVYENSIKKS